MTTIREIMSADVRMVRPEQSIREAAQLMDEIGVGALPVANQERLVGMVTDRDIAVRAVARGLPLETRVSEVMSPEVKYCFDDDDLGKIVSNMGNIQVRRLPVVDRNKRLVGIIALADIATKTSSEDAAVALSGISEPGGAHTG
jgi:CBS domain-containing protein